jgi:(E)-4-hydroxy-3-methylbut-2-enyl-diphosphate synthase
MPELYQHPFKRHQTREVRVGPVVVGGSQPIWVQSMTTTDTHDVEATVREIQHMEEAGCELVRVSVP